jgi:hypothetical protein
MGNGSSSPFSTGAYSPYISVEVIRPSFTPTPIKTCRMYQNVSLETKLDAIRSLSCPDKNENTSPLNHYGTTYVRVHFYRGYLYDTSDNCNQKIITAIYDVLGNIGIIEEPHLRHIVVHLHVYNDNKDAVDGGFVNLYKQVLFIANSINAYPHEVDKISSLFAYMDVSESFTEQFYDWRS